MGGLLKILFDILKEPLGLPLNIVDEYIILSIVELVAYKVAYEKTGILGKGCSPVDKSIIHWTIRYGLFVVIWLALRAVISVYSFVISHKSLSIVIASITASIIIGIIVYVKYKRRRLMQEELEDDTDESE